MYILLKYKNRNWSSSLDGEEVFIGREQKGNKVDVDLSPDLQVSRTHARIWLDGGFYWIEDLGSAGGTRLNGAEISGKGRRHIRAGDLIKIGETSLRVLDSAPDVQESQGPTTADATAQPLRSLDASAPTYHPDPAAGDAQRKIALFYNLPLKFGAETDVGSLLKVLVESVIYAIPAAQRGALLMEDSETGQLAMRAYAPAGTGAASRTLARQAINQLKAIIWPPSGSHARLDVDVEGSAAESIAEYKITAAMYAPLLWRGRALGALCVDTSDPDVSFFEEDLQLLQAIAHHGAMALSNLLMQEDQWRVAEVQNRLLKLVSPQISDRLIQYQGRLKLGGEFRNATILISDIRGFTNLSRTMSPDEVTEMLEDYYHRLVPLVFKYNGTVDKFIGDAILAVYGSPNPDKRQQLHAVLTAVEMQAAMSEVNARRSSQGQRVGGLGIGIHCGEVIHGLIGSAERMEFTVIGDAVNRASRYCDGADGGEILISPQVFTQVWDVVEAEERKINTKHEGKLRAHSVKGVKRDKV